MASGIVAGEIYRVSDFSPYSEEDAQERISTRLNGIRAISTMVIASDAVGVSKNAIMDAVALLSLLDDEIEIDMIHMAASSSDQPMKAAA